MKKLQILIVVMVVLLTACDPDPKGDTGNTSSDINETAVDNPTDGSTGEGNDNNNDQDGGTKSPTLTVMKKGKSYPMASGQAIVKQSNDAQIILNTDTRTGETSAILQQGKASIEEK